MLLFILTENINSQLIEKFVLKMPERLGDARILIFTAKWYA